MSKEKPHYYWDPIGVDQNTSGQPLFRQLRARSWNTWEEVNWGFYPNGLGDTCWRMGLYVASYPDDFKAIETLFYMLDNRLRYLGDRPKRMVPFLEKPRRYSHKRHDFTRDQLIGGLFGLAMAGRLDLIRELRIPWKISLKHHLTPQLYNWIKFLKTGKEKYARKFHAHLMLEYWIANKLDTKPMFSRHLNSLQLFLCPSAECSAAVMEDVHPDNIHLKILNDYDQEAILLCKPDEYVAHKGWAPQRDQYQDGLPEIDPDEDILLDKDFLIKIATLWKEKKLKENPMSLIRAMFGNASGKSIRN